MGFGMQSWVYKRRPRKPFAKRGKVPSSSPLHNFSRIFRIRLHIKKNNLCAGLLTLAVIIIIVLFAKSYIEKFVSYSKERTQLIAENIRIQENKGFSFLLSSGKRRLLSNNILGAYSEFSLAHKIKPENKELNQLLIETLSILCSKNVEYCEKLDSHLKGEF